MYMTVLLAAVGVLLGALWSQPSRDVTPVMAVAPPAAHEMVPVLPHDVLPHLRRVSVCGAGWARV